MGNNEHTGGIKTAEIKNQEELTKSIKDLKQSMGGKMKNFGLSAFSGLKQISTGKLSGNKIGIINKLLYFVSLTGISNIIYFAIFDNISILFYFLICILAPIVITQLSTSGQKSAIGDFFQKILFTDKEITIIFIISVVVLFLSKFGAI